MEKMGKKNSKNISILEAIISALALISKEANSSLRRMDFVWGCIEVDKFGNPLNIRVNKKTMNEIRRSLNYLIVKDLNNPITHFEGIPISIKKEEWLRG